METQILKTTVPLKGGYMGFHVSLGECNPLPLIVKTPHPTPRKIKNAKQCDSLPQ